MIFCYAGLYLSTGFEIWIGCSADLARHTDFQKSRGADILVRDCLTQYINFDCMQSWIVWEERNSSIDTWRSWSASAYFFNSTTRLSILRFFIGRHSLWWHRKWVPPRQVPPFRASALHVHLMALVALLETSLSFQYSVNVAISLVLTLGLCGRILEEVQ